MSYLCWFSLNNQSDALIFIIDQRNVQSERPWFSIDFLLNVQRHYQKEDLIFIKWLMNDQWGALILDQTNDKSVQFSGHHLFLSCLCWFPLNDLKMTNQNPWFSLNVKSAQLSSHHLFLRFLCWFSLNDFKEMTNQKSWFQKE